jgi:23S rRNA (adenine-N6)-dimethyltransferase
VAARPPAWWGWQRLDSAWAETLVAAAGIGAGDLVLDIGAGTGAITRPLVAAGARVIAFELHPGRAGVLRRLFAASPVVVVTADAADLLLPRRPFRVVANPPFSVTTSLIRRLVAPGSRLVRADLVVPAQVARRWCGGRGAAQARGGRDFEMSLGLRVPRGAFSPRAPMDVRLLTIVRAGGCRRGARRP